MKINMPRLTGRTAAGPAADSSANAFFWPWAGRPSSTGGTPPYITADGRDLRVDLLRGFFVFAMIVDHVRGESPLYLLTGGNRFFVSAAEGFILASGLMAGLIYRRLIARDGLGAALLKVLSRAFTLFLLTVALTLAFLPVSEALHLPWAQGVDLSRPVELVVSVLTLHRSYYLTDVMALYTLLFALSPIAFLLLERRQTAVLLGGSWLLWGVYQFFPDVAATPWPIAGNFLFQFSTWQVLFFSALALGFERDRLPAVSPRRQRQVLIASGAGFVALVAGYLVLNPPSQLLAGLLPGGGVSEAARLWIETTIFGKADVRVGRIIAAALTFTFLFAVLTRAWHILHKVTGWLLLPLGQQSLYAYTAHIVVVALVGIALAPFQLPSPGPAWFNAAIQIASVLLIWVLARGQVLAPNARTRRLWRASPAILAVAALALLPVLPGQGVQAAQGETAAVSDAAVSAAVLARARAYGTPVASLEGVPAAEADASAAVSAALLARARAYGTPVASLKVSYSAVLPAAPTALPQATPAPAPTSTPAPAAAAAAPADSTRAVAEIALATPVHAVLTSTPAPAPAQPTTAAAKVVLAQPVVAIPAAVVQPKPQAAPIVQGPVPPLPGDSRPVVSQYVGNLAGAVYERTFHSQLLNRDMPYWIYLPPGYGTDGRRYPVLYMLHGGGGVLDEWAAYGLLDVADQEMRSGKIAPFIIVLPQGDKSFWANWAGDAPRWGDYLAYEVVGQVDAGFGTLRSPAARAIGGLSMGAWGALYGAFTHPDIFGVVGAHSPSLYPDDNELKFLGVGAEFASKNPLTLAAIMPGVPSLRIFVDIGEADPWAGAAQELHAVLQARGVAHTWQLLPGGHYGDYWAQHVPDYLRFYAGALVGR